MVAVHLEAGRVAVIDRPAPARPVGHALLRLRLAGICNTDLELQRGYYHFIGQPGHEFVADVVEAEAPDWVGRRVVGEINLGCGTCDWCRRDLGRHCPHRTVLGIVHHPGAFAEQFTLPLANLRRVPDTIPDEQAVFVEPIAAACEILEQVDIPNQAEVAVLGDGKLGLLIAQVLHAVGKHVHLYGRHAHKLTVAAEAGIATYLLDRERPDLPRAAYRYVVEATGSARGLDEAIQLVQPRGTVVMKSTVHEPLSLDAAPVIVNEITLVGSRCGRFEPALQLLQNGHLHPERLIQARYPLHDAEAAFAHAATPGTLKVLLRA